MTCEVGRTLPFSTVPGRTIFCTGSGILTPEIDTHNWVSSSARASSRLLIGSDISPKHLATVSCFFFFIYICGSLISFCQQRMAHLVTVVFHRYHKIIEVILQT